MVGSDRRPQKASGLKSGNSRMSAPSRSRTLNFMDLTASSAKDSSRRRLVRVCLGYLAIQAALIGLWASFAPHSWFRSFPGLGLHWVGIDGSYNHHLVVDVGGLFLALLIVTIAAFAEQGRALVRTAGLAWVVSALPHFLYHATHRAGLSSADWVASLSGLAGQVGLGLLCLAAAPRLSASTSDRPLRDPAVAAPRT